MSFTYNDEGIRTSKTVNGVTHTYQLNGSQIVSEQWGDKLLVYLYDASGAPIGMMYRTTSYAINTFDVFWFEKNLQGDIVAVYGGSGTKFVTYEYDAWGNQTVSYSNGGGSTGAQYNPFRYRGYYYDTDLEMYYLQSRYYDPNTCRFISPDDVIYLGSNGDLISFNLYAYCSNNPVMGYDPFGHWDWESLKEFGINCLKVAIETAAISVSLLAIGMSIGGTIMSGGAGAISIPVAVAIASKALVVSSVVIASIGVVSTVASEAGITVSHLIGENGTQTPSTTTWNGKGKERLDVENPSPGKRAGQIHYHDGKNKPYMFDFTNNQFINPTGRLKKLMSNKGFLKGFEKALKILGVRP